MKTRALLLTVVFLLTGMLAYGQVSIGPKVGLTMATMPAAVGENGELNNLAHPEFQWWDLNYLENLEAGYLPGYQVGVLVEIPILDFFALQPELLYSAKGFKVDLTEMYDDDYMHADDKYVFQMRNHYLEVPILGKFIYDVGDTKVALMAGPYFAYATNGSFNEVAKWIYENTEGEEFTEKEWYGYKMCYGNKDFSDFVHRYDVGAAVGAGVTVPIGCENNLMFDFRYNHGFIDFNNWSNLEAEPDDEGFSAITKPDPYTPLTNRNFSVSMGYTFGFN